jgi:hypothetical protein
VVPLSPAVIRGFNPQPEPPGRETVFVSRSLVLSPGIIRGFNPQPEPPGVELEGSVLANQYHLGGPAV